MSKTTADLAVDAIEAQIEKEQEPEEKQRLLLKRESLQAAQFKRTMARLAKLKARGDK